MAGILIILATPIVFGYCLFTRCLKRRPDPETGKFRWVCRKSVARCKCWNRPPREIKEISPPTKKDENPVEAAEVSTRKPLKATSHAVKGLPVKGKGKRQDPTPPPQVDEEYEYDEEVEQVLEGKKHNSR